jgi:Tol biopolymer transport system component
MKTALQRLGLMWLLCAGAIGLVMLVGAVRQGAMLSFVAQDETGQRDIYLLDATTGVLHNLTDNAADEWSFAWSVDASLLYSTTLEVGSGDTLLLRDAAGRSVQTLDADTLLAFNMAWSPDGRYLAYVSSYPRNVSDIFLLDVNTLQTRRLTNTPERSESSPVWIPESQVLVYVADGHLWQQSIQQDGRSARQLTFDRATDHRPVPAPDGRQIAFRRTDARQTRLYVLDTASGDERLLQTDAVELSQSLTWFADSQTLLAGRGSASLVQIDAQQGTIADVPVPHARHYSAVAAPSGDMVAYIDGIQRELHLISTTTARHRHRIRGLRVLPPLVWLPG